MTADERAATDRLLEAQSVAIPMSHEERLEKPSEGEILGAYEAELRRRRSRHLGYPYNLEYENDKLDPFMRYSINNLGDPFVTSNYGVHSRAFEVGGARKPFVVNLPPDLTLPCPKPSTRSRWWTFSPSSGRRTTSTTGAT